MCIEEGTEGGDEGRKCRQLGIDRKWVGGWMRVQL